MAYTIDISEAPKGTYAKVRVLLSGLGIDFDYNKPVFTFDPGDQEETVAQSLSEAAIAFSSPASAPATSPEPEPETAPTLPPPVAPAEPPAPAPLDFTGCRFIIVARTKLGLRRVAGGKMYNKYSPESILDEHGGGKITITDRKGNVVFTLSK
jgi:hypothetical protein